MKKLSTIVILCGLAHIFVSCANPLDILGPRDKPKIASEQWNQIQVTYWIFTKGQNEKIQRTFTINDPAAVSDLKTKLQVSKTEGLSIGSGSQLAFKYQNNEVWHGEFVFEDTIYMALSEDGWRSYKFTLSNTDFYDELRILCAHNEKKYHPKASWKNIMLRSNLSFDYPKL